MNCDLCQAFDSIKAPVMSGTDILAELPRLNERMLTCDYFMMFPRTADQSAEMSRGSGTVQNIGAPNLFDPICCVSV